jgi:hypothetical protein
MKKILFSLFFVFVITQAKAQDYNTGIGLRGGWFSGLTVKHFIGESSALEGLLETRWKGFNITGLYEKHKRFPVRRFYWYYGFGGHIGFWNGGDVSWINETNNQTIIGIDGIIGIEYNFREVPFNISLDWKPAINLVGYSSFWGDNGAFSVRYIF